MPWPGGIPQQEEINADGTAGGLVGLPLLQPLSRYKPPARPVVRIARREEEGDGGLKKRQMQDVLAIVRDSNQLQRDMAAARDAREGREEAKDDDAPQQPAVYSPAYGVAIPFGYTYAYKQQPERAAEEQDPVPGPEADVPQAAASERWADQDHAWAMRGKKKAPPPRPLTVDASVSYSRALEAAATAQEAAAFSPSAQVNPPCWCASQLS